MSTPITIRRQISMVRIFIDRCDGRSITDQLKDPAPALESNVSHTKVEQVDNASAYSDAPVEYSSLVDDSSSQSGGPLGDDSAGEAASSSGLGGFGPL